MVRCTPRCGRRTVPDVPYERCAVLGKRFYYRCEQLECIFLRFLRSHNPESLPSSKEFLHVDLRVILAFLFMAILKEGPRQTEHRTGPRSNISGAVLKVQIIKPDIAILHLEKNHRENVHEGVRPTPFGRMPPQGPLAGEVQNASQKGRYVKDGIIDTHAIPISFLNSCEQRRF